MDRSRPTTRCSPACVVTCSPMAIATRKAWRSGPTGACTNPSMGKTRTTKSMSSTAGRNYGWPLIAGYQDDQYYTYANWSASAPTPCASLSYGRDVPDTVPQTRESSVNLPDFSPPLKTFFTVPTGYDVRKLGNATAALTGLDVYSSSAIPNWSPSILVCGMASGVIYRIPLNATVRSAADLFQGARPLSRPRDRPRRQAHLCDHVDLRPHRDGVGRADGDARSSGSAARVHVHGAQVTGTEKAAAAFQVNANETVRRRIT